VELVQGASNSISRIGQHIAQLNIQPTLTIHIIRLKILERVKVMESEHRNAACTHASLILPTAYPLPDACSCFTDCLQQV